MGYIVATVVGKNRKNIKRDVVSGRLMEPFSGIQYIDSDKA